MINYFARIIFLAFIELGLSSKIILGVVPNLDLINSITAVTLPRASYDIGLTAYDNGSLQVKAVLGLHDNIYLGASFDVENLIGNGSIGFNIPGVIVKFKLTDGWESFPLLIALGYDSFYTGENGRALKTHNPFDRIIYGPYIAMSRPLFMFGLEQHIHMGVRIPVQPNFTPENTAIYFGFDFPFNIIVPMFEINRIYFTSNRLKEILFNAGVKFNLVEHFSFELNFLIDLQGNTSRVLVLEYINFF